MLLCLISFVSVSVSEPGQLNCIIKCHLKIYSGTVDDSNVEDLGQLYEYDGLIFPEGRICETCNIPRQVFYNTFINS